MGFFTNIWKSLLIIVNIVFLLLGCAVIGCGIWALNTVDNSYPRNELNSLQELITIVVRVLLTVGSITALISFLGFWGIISEKKWMLKTYASFLVLLIILQICIAIIAPICLFGSRESYKLRAEGVVNSDTDNIDFIQRNLECCGYNGPEEMRNISGLYPLSCCDSEMGLCVEPYPVGCWPAYTHVMMTYGTIAGGFIGAEILCVFAAVFVTSSISKKRKGVPLYNRMN